ncbi:glycine betaine ABC transporter substrate-binding protein [Nitrincola alkalilacustris]|uniref:glycine betaine ABC transporter substrate-binding protein n=1 Tax=Nitrincola alkalilacustris TaxID=1571224 RepID=UPI00124DC5BB|nr:glycine betaine ABC transporter substrate-binding protein [Nitrincola alkalilacustris]
MHKLIKPFIKPLIKPLGITLAAMSMSFGAMASSLVVGGKNFTEQQILTEMTAQYLDHLGYSVQRRGGMGSAVLRAAQENGQIDLYWEYTGTSLLNYNQVEEKLDTPEAVYEKVRELDAQKGLVWLNPSRANNTYALAVRQVDSVLKNMHTLSDLAAAINSGEKLVLASNAEWYARDDGLRPLQETYGFELPRSQVKRMDSGLTYVALREQQVDVALVFATDGRIPAFDFVILEDDKGFFPDYAITPVVRQDTLDKNPELADQLNALSAKIDNDIMATLNARVDVERQAIEAVAENFLREAGLL